MKKALLSITLIALFSTAFSQHASLEQGVIEKLASADENELIPVFLVLADAIDINQLELEMKAEKIPVSKRAKLVMQSLKGKAKATQPSVVEFIENSSLPFEQIQRFWIANAIAVNASAALINELVNLSAIERIELNTPQFSLIVPEKGEKSDSKSVGGIEPGLAAIGAPEMWAMGYTGSGRLALTFDTGVLPDHPSFKNRYLVNRMPYASTWFGYDSPVPTDKASSHGTHVSGTILGLDTATADTIGVAFGAYLIATDPIVSDLADVKPLSEIMLGYEWAMNPDGDENTSNDIPDVINNSWGRDNTVVDQDWTVCPELVGTVLTTVQAAGIANVFSAGNEGPNDMTIGVPHNLNTGLVNSFTVAAVNGNSASFWPIAEFSSRGPSLCGGEGSLLIKPEVSAPGVSVRSSVENGGYASNSGTSMASPHVSGAILLLKEAFPYLSGEDLMLALYYSATDLGPAGEDNTYGMGMINVKAAYDYLSLTNTPVMPSTPEIDLDLVSIDFPTEDLQCGFESSDFSPIITVINKGMNDVTGITIHSQLNNGSIATYTDEDITILAGSEIQLTLPEMLYTAAIENELHIWIEELDNESDLFNNHNISRWRVLPTEDFYLGFSENFENGISTDVWTIINPDGKTTWDTLSNIIQSNGELGTAAWMDFREYYPIASQKDQLITPLLTEPIDFNVLGPAILSFDLFYRKGSSNNFTKDTLVISVRQQCSEEEMYNSELLRRGGNDLYTVNEGSFALLPQNGDEWQNIQLEFDLVAPFGQKFYIVFEGINRHGNHLLIDNINIEVTSDVGISKTEKAIEFNIYPNPTKGLFTVESDDLNKAETLNVYDIYGRKVHEQAIVGSQNNYDLSNLVTGVYLISIDWNDGSKSVKKLVIQ